MANISQKSVGLYFRPAEIQVAEEHEALRRQKKVEKKEVLHRKKTGGLILAFCAAVTAVVWVRGETTDLTGLLLIAFAGVTYLLP